MIHFAHIWQSISTKTSSLISSRALLRIIILCAFICGQIGTSAHSHAHEAHYKDEHVHEHHHEHDHEEQEHPTLCELCTLAATEEDIEDNIYFPEILDGPDFLNWSSIMSSYRFDAKAITQYFQFSNQLNTTAAYHLLDAARAPPLR